MQGIKIMPLLVQVVEITNDRFELISHYPNRTITDTIDGSTFDRIIPTLSASQVPIEYPSPLAL
jgi:hypothetical protein